MVNEVDPRTNNPRRLKDLMASVLNDADARHRARNTGERLGPGTGLPSLDRELGGGLPIGTSMLLGGTGVGKSAFALQLSAHCGTPAIYLSTEMAPAELVRRLIATQTNTFLGRLKSGELSRDEVLALLLATCEKVPDLFILDGTSGFVAPQRVQDAAMALRGDRPGFVVVVDSLHSHADSVPVEGSEYDRLNAALAGWRTLALGVPCSVLLIAERNRASASTGGISAGAGTRKIEYGAEVLMELDRDGEEDLNGEVPIKLKILKNRNGSAGKTINLRFAGRLQRFREAK